MMRCAQGIVCFVLALSAPVLVLAQTPNSDADLIREQLLVKVQGQMIGSVNAKTGLMTASTIRTWTPYKGFTAISEEQFFSIAGFEQEADQARRFHSKRKVMLSVGGIGMLLGLAGMMTPFLDDFSNWSMDFMWISAGVLTASSIPLFMAVFRPNWATVEIAIRVADTYNASLAKKRER